MHPPVKNYKKYFSYYIIITENQKKCKGIRIILQFVYNFRAFLKTRLIKEKTDRCGSCKETFRRRAAALRGRLTQQMSCIAVFSQKGFLEMPYIYLCLNCDFWSNITRTYLLVLLLHRYKTHHDL